MVKARVFQHAFVQAFCASWLIVFATQIKVPFYPAPTTMQSFTIMLVSLLAIRRTAVGAVLLYLTYGAIGIPVFANGVGGLSIFTGPTAGYLLGFIWMANAIAFLKQRYPDSRFRLLFGLLLLSNIICLFVPGLCWLAYLLGWEKALQVGLLPFLLILPTKAALAAYLSVYIRERYANI